eukprot:Polyplicarium_translucidae@DN2172_c0_g1_i5.p1
MLNVRAVVAALGAWGCSGGKYHEEHRPQFHYSPHSNWMGTPSALVYDSVARQFHMHYEYHPWGSAPGLMHWGHASSDDLVHWKQQPVAIFPDSRGAILPGGAVKILSAEQGAMARLAAGTTVLFFTQQCTYDPRHAETARDDPLSLTCITPDYDAMESPYYVQHQSMATTVDFQAYAVAANPVIVADLAKYGKDMRDPWVVWHLDSWYMVLANGHVARFFRSTDLVEWTETGSFGRGDSNPDAMWMSPSLHNLGSAWLFVVSAKATGRPGGKGSRTIYFIGAFEGGVFVPDDRWDHPNTPGLLLDFGTDVFGATRWITSPGEAVIFTAWMGNWAYAQDAPTSPWRGVMSVPRALALVAHEGRLHLHSAPYPRMKDLRCGRTVEHAALIDPLKDVSVTTDPCRRDAVIYHGLLDLEITVTGNSAGVPRNFGQRERRYNKSFAGRGFPASVV